MRKPALIIDLDGTLADCDHRREKSAKPDGKLNWKLFFEGMEDDGLNVWCREIIMRFCDDHAILLVSGRSTSNEEVTRAWLSKHQIPYTALMMRGQSDSRADTVVKREIYEQRIAPHYDVLFCVDDRASVVEMWRSIGLTVLQCAKGEF